ncbi:hypothetical protein [Sphingomonas aurantiaca]|uniref:hypothetical protein n=1 Tax=Sphingomonas aurantiaca TaxID=185949 RepID=UPI003347074E
MIAPFGFLSILDIPLTPKRGPSKQISRFQVADVRSEMHCAYMEHATLVAFLSGTLSPEVLAGEIATEVGACNATCQAGGTGYIIITDGPSFEVKREGARRLLAAIAEERLSFELANYVADCLIMSDDFDFADDAVRDSIHFAGDESTSPTKDETVKALAMLG